MTSVMASVAAPPHLYETFREDIVSSFTAALARAYDTATEGHDTERGHNEATFGFNLYHFAVFELGRVCESLAQADIEVTRTSSNCFRVAVGSFSMACYRVGDSADDEIRTAFPSRDAVVKRLHKEQAWLPGTEPKLADGCTVVLAHLGNPRTGFEAAYLCIPTGGDAEAAREWAFTHPVFVKSDSASEPAHPLPKELVPPEFIGEPQVTRKPAVSQVATHSS